MSIPKMTIHVKPASVKSRLWFNQNSAELNEDAVIAHQELQNILGYQYL